MVSFPCLYFNIKVHNGLETAKLNLVTRTITVQKWKKIYGLIAVHYIIGFQLWHILLCEAKFRGICVFPPYLAVQFCALLFNFGILPLLFKSQHDFAPSQRDFATNQCSKQGQTHAY